MEHPVLQHLAGLLVLLLYITVSSGLVGYNKFLLQVFPYPLQLTALHMLSCSLMSVLTFALMPGLFPAMKELDGRKVELLKYFLPVGACFSGAMYFSNSAYLYCSVAFLQYMKESTVLLPFLFYCAVGMQRMDRVKAVVVMWILLGSWMCIRGETNFILIGLFVQAIAQFAECSKNILGEYLMSNTNFKLDPMTYTMFIAPVSLIFLSVGVAMTWTPDVAAALMANWHYLLPNMVLAFLLNVIIAIVLKHCSAVGVIMAGISKDILLVVASEQIFRDPVTLQQSIGFAITLAGCATWSVLRLMPSCLLARALETITVMPRDKGEARPLVARGRSRSLV
eukprot:CAMPEP_0170607832 /NCGR_PEP_ID=MMETSP0224-20130122/21261_1 /TAXON_ID=285029 /ORGANISM="Togula jolla, Strain CCCM 725" /LENGTH=337 /DNA_ID=CAMNT_0010933017 /DNA_START=62 /DNA_END=1075 /DNA_ORIENTATION=-